MKTTTHTLASIVGIAGVFGGFAGIASAVIVQLPNQSGAIVSDASTGQSIADDFIVGSGGASLDTLTWWGGYLSGNVPGNDSFTVRIHGDAGGLPDGLPAFVDMSGIAGARTATGGSLFGVAEYQYTFDFGGLNLGAGTYWLEIFNDAAQSGERWSWETGNLDPINGRARSAGAFQNPGVNWFSNGPELAFSFKTVPAPGSLALLGLAGCASTQRRRR